jgi:hypothetical protein
VKKILTSILLIVCFATVLLGQTTWISRTSGTTKEITKIIYINNQYVALGWTDSTAGASFTSSNGITWTHSSSGIPLDSSSRKPISLSGITYGFNQYLAVASYPGTSLTSPNGTSWTVAGIIPFFVLDVTFGNNLYVAVGTNAAFSSGSICTSPDGITWTARTSGTINSLYKVAYANNLYVAAGVQGTILTSPDGITWTTRTSKPGANLSGIAYGNNQYVVVGNSSSYFTSPDGITWTARTTPYQALIGITYGNNEFVAVGGAGKIYTSPDAITWTARISGFSTNYNFNSVIYANNQYVAVGTLGTIITSPVTNAISYSALKLRCSVRGQTLQIYTLQGKLVAQKKIVADNYFDGKSTLYKNLSKGMYIVRIPTGSAAISRRVLVE